MKKTELKNIEPLSVQAVSDIFSSKSISVSEDLIEFYSEFNGACGFVDDIYVDIWNLKELFELNEEYNVSKYMKNVILFGSDGGDTAFGYDCKKDEYFIVPLIGMGIDEAEYFGNSYNSFFNALVEFFAE